MRRREFISLLGGATVAWPLAARAQQAAMPLIGFLSNVSPGTVAHAVAAFRQGLKETGYIEGQNLAIEYRWAEGHNDRLSELAADLVQHQVAVIVATGGGASALAVKAATTTIPTVFSSATDPVQLGLVASFNRPGGNVTGIYVMTNSLEAKRLGLLHELVQNAATIAVLVNPSTPGAETQLMEAQSAARTVARQTSRRPSRLWPKYEPKHSLSQPIRSSMASANGSSRWQRATPFLRFTSFGSSPQPVA